MAEPHSSNFRAITINFLGVRIFRKFMVKIVMPNLIVNKIRLKTTPFARSFRRRFFAYHYAVYHPHTNIIL